MTPPSTILPLNVVDLIARFDVVCAGSSAERAVRVVSNDASARLAALQSFYQRLVEHPRFGGAWPWSLPPGALAPAIPPSAFPGIPPRMLWFGLCCSAEPGAEPAQLLEQLDQLSRFPDLEPWVHEAAGTAFRAALAGTPPASGQERQGLAFGFLDRLPGPGADLAMAVRTLSMAVTGTPLFADGGALGLDGPDHAARALVAAGWIERLARATPVVVAIDEAQRAGAFVVSLVETLLQGDAPVLVVLAGEPPAAGTDAPVLAGPLGAVDATSAQAFTLPSGDAGYLAAALARLSVDGVVADEHVHVAADALGVADEAAPLQEELVATGWLRGLTAGVHAFANAARHQAAVSQATAMVGDVITDPAALCRHAAGRTDAAEGLTRMVAAGALAGAAGPTTDAAWHHAVLLARSGQLGRAVAAGGGAANAPVRRAVMAAWRRAAGADAPEPTARPPSANDVGSTPLEEAERRIVLAATIGAADPNAASAHLMAALAALEAAEPNPETPSRLRLAAARVFLAIGHLDGLAQALGPEAPRWLPAPVVKRLVELHAWHRRPGLVARSVELAVLGRTVDVLREHVPGSVALARAQLTLVTRLERYDRLRSDDESSAQLAADAVAVFRRGHASPPLGLWTARTVAAACALRQGHQTAAVAELAALVDEECAVLRADHPTVLDTKLWLARALLVADRLDAAATVFDQVRRARDGAGPPNDAWRLSADDGVAAVLAAHRRHDEAAAMVAAVVAHRAAASGRDDEDLLASRHVLGAALTRTGHLERALRELDEVVSRRALNDLPDSGRLTAARHERAECLMLLRRYADALAELDVVVAQRARTRPASDAALVTARTDRGLCLLMLRRWAEAIAELNPALAVLHARNNPDDEHLLLVRQQRGVCLHALGRASEAAIEFDGILAATAHWPRDHRLVTTVLRQRAELTSAAAAG